MGKEDDGYPTPYELGDMFGSIKTGLESVHKRLDDGDNTMKDLHTTIEDGFKEQKENMHDCKIHQVKQRGKIHKKINNTDHALELHAGRDHLFQRTEKERLGVRLRRHAPEIGTTTGISTIIGSIVLLLLKVAGYI